LDHDVNKSLALKAREGIKKKIAPALANMLASDLTFIHLSLLIISLRKTIHARPN
tara:strand:- start:973 stop:1137 length:165 start_codon:yes stop_codon:yes gene_type:complete